MLNTKSFGISLASSLVLFGCSGEAPSDGEASQQVQQPGIATTDGLSAINGLTSSIGLTAANGSANANGLSTNNGLSTPNGLSATNGLITTAAGRATVTYLAKCALSSGQSFTKTYGGTTYTFAGSLGFAPAWLNGPVSAVEKEIVSACLLAMVDPSNVPVAIYLDPQGGTIDVNSSYSVQEGAYYGDIFTSPPKAYSCRGASQAALPPSRMCGTNLSSCPYVSTGICASPGNRAQGVGSGAPFAGYAGFINAQALATTRMDGAGGTQFPNDRHGYQTLTVWDQGR